MRVGLMIEGQEGVSWEDWQALAGACEENGVEALFRSDHYLSVEGRADRGSLDAWATLSALAAITSTVRLGTLVSPATFRHPSQLAKVVVTADHVSGGRVELGMGTGWLEAEHAAYGFPFPPFAERLAQLEEQLEVVSREWADGPVVGYVGRIEQAKGTLDLVRAMDSVEARLVLIGDGTDWRRAIYHHTRLVSDPNVSDKEARSAANCMVLLPACHDDPVEFYN